MMFRIPRSLIGLVLEDKCDIPLSSQEHVILHRDNYHVHTQQQLVYIRVHAYVCVLDSYCHVQTRVYHTSCKQSFTDKAMDELICLNMHAK